MITPIECAVDCLDLCADVLTSQSRHEIREQDMSGPAKLPTEIHRSTRDPEVVRSELEKSLARHIPEGTEHSVGPLQSSSATGVSSETFLFDASWRQDGAARTERLVARLAPDEHDMPVFPRYDLQGQFETIVAVQKLTDVPVPVPWWYEPALGHIDSPFFVMGQVDGQIPPDVMPYNFGEGWVFHSSLEQQEKMQAETISVLARLHAVEDPARHFRNLMGEFPGDTALRRHFASRQKWYQWALRDCGPSRLVEQAFVWLEERFPADEGKTVFSWGDSRIGNVIYQDFTPAAVLDWEMAALGPRELDLSWLVYMHEMFEDLARKFGQAGMPSFLRADDVATTYEKLTGHTARYLDWYEVYSCVQLSIVLLRTVQRSIHFGQRPPASDADELLMNAPRLAELIS